MTPMQLQWTVILLLSLGAGALAEDQSDRPEVVRVMGNAGA